MKLSEIINSIRPASFAEKSVTRIVGVAGGIDVTLPYLQAGWINSADSQYTVGSPRVILAGVRSQITINGLGATTNIAFANGMHSDVWSGNVFRPTAVGEAYTVRLNCLIAQTNAGVGAYVNFEADIGTPGVPFIAASESVSLLKGQGVATQLTISAPFFCLDTFGLNGAKLYITPSVDITVWNFAIFIQRTFRP